MAKHSVIFLVLTLFAVSVFANIPTANVVSPTSTLNVPKLEFIKNYSGKNQIRLLNNRFRVDYHVEEVMMLFFRKHGSRPIVLIQPDGSKIYPQDASEKNIEWHADVGYDLIKLKNPMPGPWQAVGRILPDSKIIVLSDIQLQADPFPERVFQYEIIKAQARVINANEMIKAKTFGEVIRLRASLYPSKDPKKDNFGSSIYQLGDFLDNGQDLDERPRDGVFTIKYTINTGYGEWIPNYRITAELFTRELIQEPIDVMPSPITFTAIPAQVDDAGEEGRYHYVTFAVDDTYIDNSTMLFQGTIRFPNGEKQTFSIEGLQERRLEIFNGEYGVFTIEMDAFGTTKDKREISLDLPQFQFVTQEPEFEIPEMTLPAMTEMTEVAEPEVIVPPEPEFPIVMVAFINLFVISGGCLVIWVFVLKKPIHNPFAGLLDKLKSVKLKPKSKDKAEPASSSKDEKVEPEKEKKKPEPDDSNDDILDLSLPED